MRKKDDPRVKFSTSNLSGSIGSEFEKGARRLARAAAER